MSPDRSPVPVLRAFRRTSDCWVETDPPVPPSPQEGRRWDEDEKDEVSPSAHRDRGAAAATPGEHAGGPGARTGGGRRPGGRPAGGRRGGWAPGHGDEALWIVVEDPKDVLDAAELHNLEVHGLRTRLAQISSASTRSVARVVRINEHALFVVVPTAAYADEQVTTGRLALLLTHEGIVTAESGTAGITEKVVDRLTERRALKGSGPLPVLAAMLVELISAASEVELALGDAVAHLENVVFRLDDDPLGRLYNLKREISEARRALLPLSVELPELGDDHTTSAVEPLRLEKPLLDRLIAHAERIDRHLDGHDALLSDMLTVRLSQISVRQNEDMRKISAWAAIAAVPTLVAGVYGMNFHDMPELTWAWGYPAALGGMAALCVGLYLAFKRAGWL